MEARAGVAGLHLAGLQMRPPKAATADIYSGLSKFILEMSKSIFLFPKGQNLHFYSQNVKIYSGTVKIYIFKVSFFWQPTSNDLIPNTDNVDTICFDMVLCMFHWQRAILIWKPPMVLLQNKGPPRNAQLQTMQFNPPCTSARRWRYEICCPHRWLTPLDANVDTQDDC